MFLPTNHTLIRISKNPILGDLSCQTQTQTHTDSDTDIQRHRVIDTHIRTCTGIKTQRQTYKVRRMCQGCVRFPVLAGAVCHVLTAVDRSMKETRASEK